MYQCSHVKEKWHFAGMSGGYCGFVRTAMIGCVNGRYAGAKCATYLAFSIWETLVAVACLAHGVKTSPRGVHRGKNKAQPG